MSVYFVRKARATEDAVTGLVVDLLRAWPTRETLLALIGRAVPHAASPWSLPLFDELEIEEWPPWVSGEPDLFLSLRLDDVCVAYVIVEAKLGAEKSGEDTDPVSEGEPTRDQLAKYQRDASARCHGAPIIVVYLTHHVAPPTEDLALSLAAMKHPISQGDAPRLAWCSWRDVEARLRSLQGDRALRAYADGLADVLQSVGMYRFSGAWTGPRVGEPLPARIFWKCDRAQMRMAYTWSCTAAGPVGRPPPLLLIARRGSFRWSRRLPLNPRVAFFRRTSS